MENTLKFPTQPWAVFNLHVNNAGDRAMKVCEAAFPADDEDLIALKSAHDTGIMAIFHVSPNAVTQLFADACLIFANGLDAHEEPEAGVHKCTS